MTMSRKKIRITGWGIFAISIYGLYSAMLLSGYIGYMGEPWDTLSIVLGAIGLLISSLLLFLGYVFSTDKPSQSTKSMQTDKHTQPNKLKEPRYYFISYVKKSELGMAYGHCIYVATNDTLATITKDITNSSPDCSETVIINLRLLDKDEYLMLKGDEK